VALRKPSTSAWMAMAVQSPVPRSITFSTTQSHKPLDENLIKFTVNVDKNEAVTFGEHRPRAEVVGDVVDQCAVHVEDRGAELHASGSIARAPTVATAALPRRQSSVR